MAKTNYIEVDTSEEDRQLCDRCKSRTYYKTVMSRMRTERVCKSCLRLSGSVPVRTGPKPERNQPCPCGSGIKFKKCCYR